MTETMELRIEKVDVLLQEFLPPYVATFISILKSGGLPAKKVKSIVQGDV